MKGLLIRAPWIDYIFDGKKTWEIRGSNTNIRGTVALIKSGSGMVFGTVDLVDSKKLSLEEYQLSEKYHCVQKSECLEMPYKNTHAWVVDNPILFDNPIPYKHPMGAIIWVSLYEELFAHTR